MPPYSGWAAQRIARRLAQSFVQPLKQTRCTAHGASHDDAQIWTQERARADVPPWTGQWPPSGQLDTCLKQLSSDATLRPLIALLLPPMDSTSAPTATGLPTEQPAHDWYTCGETCRTLAIPITMIHAPSQMVPCCGEHHASLIKGSAGSPLTAIIHNAR